MPNKTRFTGNLVSDDSIFSDNMNDGVGIGTTNPTTRISIAGTTRISFADNNIRIGDVSIGSSITNGTNNFL